MLNAYKPTCAPTVVDKGAEFSFVPQFGQKYQFAKTGW